jgi:NAD+ synthase (glutamine-hydrolysing)
LGQINPAVGDFPSNLEKILAFIREAQAAECDLILFPELSLCGYPPEDLLLKKSFVERNRQYLDKLVQASEGMSVVCGFAGSSDTRLFNSAAVISMGKLLMTYHKIALPNYGVFDEKRYFQPGKEVPLLRLGSTLIGINICEDIWICPGITEQQASLGAKLIINISASPYHQHKLEERVELLRDRAIRNYCHIGYLNMVGGQDELVFDGASLMLDPQGKVIARAGQFREELLIIDIPENEPPEHLACGMSSVPAAADKDGFSFRCEELTSQFYGRHRQMISPTCAEPLSDEEEVYQALVLGTRDYIAKNGFRKVIIGLSGGIDSALTLAVAVDAIGKENVCTLFMPSRFTVELSHTAAARQALLLDVTLNQVSIDSLLAEYLQALQPLFKDTESGLTEENLQARIRGNLLMALSNKFGYLVLNTSNKSEAAVGYTTLYGDMVGGFSVLKDIPKTLVFKISRYLNRSRGRETIAPEIIDRPPSAELKANQFDTDSLPPYDVLDEILRRYVELDWSDHDIVAAGFDETTVAKVIRLVGAAEYKRRQSAPGIKITPRAFGKDRRWPITNKFRD